MSNYRKRIPRRSHRPSQPLCRHGGGEAQHRPYHPAQDCGGVSRYGHGDLRGGFVVHLFHDISYEQLFNQPGKL